MRLSKTNLKNLNKLSGKELDLYLYVILAQDKNGISKGFDNKQITNNLDISHAHSYIIKENLAKKGFWICKSQHDNWIFELQNSNLEYCIKNGYVNLNRNFFTNLQFMQLSKNEKIIYLNILVQSDYKIKTIELNFKTLIKWTGATMVAIRKYVKTLKDLFKDKMRVEYNKSALKHKIYIENNKLFDKSENTEILYQKEQELKYLTKITKIKKINQNTLAIKDVAKLYNQYGNVVRDSEKLNDFIINSVYDSIRNQGKIIAKYVHKIVSIKINELKNSTSSKMKKQNFTKDKYKINYKNNMNNIFPKNKFINKVAAEKELKELIYYKCTYEAENESLDLSIQALSYLLTLNEKGYIFDNKYILIQDIYDKLADICSLNGNFLLDEFNYLISDFITHKALKIHEDKNIINKYPYLTKSLYNFILNYDLGQKTRENKNKFQNHEQREYNFAELEELERLLLRADTLTAEQYKNQYDAIKNKYKNSSSCATQNKNLPSMQKEKNKNKFQNHEQREWDFEELEKLEREYLKKYFYQK